jgi:hypothetical protein
MMALTGIIFAMGFVMVQFSAIAYSPRLVLWFARDRTLFHALARFRQPSPSPSRRSPGSIVGEMDWSRASDYRAGGNNLKPTRQL